MDESLITLIEGGYFTDTSGIAVGDNDQPFRLRTILAGREEFNTDDGMLYKILDMMPKGSESDDKYEFVLSDLRQQVVNVLTGADATGATIVLASGEGKRVIANSLIHNVRTTEQIYVKSVSGDTLTVSRGFAGTANTPVAVGDKLIILPTQLGEKASANGGNGSIPTYDYNYIEASSDSFNMSDRQFNASMLMGVGTVPQEMKEMTTAINQKINNALIYGTRGVAESPSGAGDGLVYTTAGFKSVAKTHELNLEGNNGLLEYSTLNAFLEPMFDNSATSMTKTMLAGPALFGAICRIAEDRNHSDPVYNSVLGSYVTKINTRNAGAVEVMRDRGAFTANNGAGGDGIVIDLAHVQMIEKQGMPMQWRQNIQANNAHNRQDEFYGTYSLKMVNEATMGTISGASAEY